MDRLNTGIVILAAGASSRMGRSKQLLNVEGKPLLALTSEAAVSSLAAKTVIVLGANHEEHARIISVFPLDAVINDAWQKGMGNSLKCGLNFLLNSDASLNSVIILVCDQPMVTAAHINRLIDKYQQSRKPIIVSGYAETAGVPALFDQSYFAKLLHLKDEQGAKNIILENMADVAIVDFPEGSIDLDTTEDYERFIDTTKNRKNPDNF